MTAAITAADQRREWLLILLLLAIMLVKGAVWALAFPLWQGPDEDDHYAVIQFIGEQGRLPDEADLDLADEIALSRDLADVGRINYRPEQRQSFSNTPEGPGEAALAALPPATRSSAPQLGAVGKLLHATPIYYALAAIPYRLVGYESDLLVRAMVQRLLVVLLSSPIVIAAYLLTRLLLPNQPLLRITVPVLVAFHPQLTQMTAVISVDGFFFLIYTLLIYLSVRVLQDGLTLRRTLAIALTFALGVLVKPTLNGFAPLVALVVAYEWWRRRGSRARVVWLAVLMNALILLPVGWWMQRSWRLNGDLFYFNPVVEGHRIILNPFYDYGFFTHMADYYRSVWGGIFVTWWAHFGWLDTALPPVVYTILRLLTFLAIAGLLLQLWRMRRRGWPTWTAWQAGGGPAPLPVWGFLALTLLVPVLLLQFYDLTFWWEYGVGRGLQGRYWLGTVVVMLTFWAVGLLCLLPARWRPAGHQLLRVGMVVLNVVSLLGYILPRYYL